MKPLVNLRWVFLFLSLSAFLISCQKEYSEFRPVAEPDVVMKELQDCSTVTNLIAAQFYDVGDIYVTHDESFIYVKYMMTEPGWCLHETHLHIATTLAGIPMTKNGNPKVGQFEYSGSHDCLTEYTYTIPLAWAPGAELVIAAHAVVGQSGGDNTSRNTFYPSGHETAWGEGVSFPGNNWAMYFDFQLCDDGNGGLGQEIEEAYGYAPDGSGTASQCFLDLGISDDWGFIVGPFIENFTFELRALPDGTCDIEEGFLVGQVEVVPKGGNKVDVVYTTYEGYSLAEAHLWVSEVFWNMDETVITAEFPYNALALGGSLTYTFRNVLVRGPVYMIINAKVYGVVHNG